MKIDVIASERQYQDHMLPIWAALPLSLQGTVRPVEPQPVSRPPLGRIAMVAGWQDVQPLRGTCRMIYVEHGAGQTYKDAHHDPSYSASEGARHQGVIGYVCPSETVAARWKNAPAIAVGSPKMDEWVRFVKPPSEKPTVCFAWHWDATVAPEAKTAWPHYQRLFPRIVERFRDQGFDVAGHSHPKWRGKLDPVLSAAGVDVFGSDREVFAHADILIVDNSSLAFEVASLGRPVLNLNAPWYRRDIEHGLRFWSHPPGLEFNEPEELLDFNLWDCLHETPARLIGEFRRKAAVEHAYAFTDGSSAQRAAAWITELVSSV